MMKRAFAILTAITVLLCINANADFTFNENGIYYETADFDEYDNAFSFPKESAVGQDDLIYSRNGANVTVYNSRGYSYLNYFATGDNANHGMQAVKRFRHTYTAEDKSAVLSFTARAAEKSERRIWFKNGNGTDLYFTMKLDADFEFSGTKNNAKVYITAFDYDDGEMHDFKFVFDLENGYVKLYFDGELAAENIALKSGFELYEARFSSAVRASGWNIENIEASNDESLMPGTVKAEYSNDMLALSANGDCEIKYALGADRAAALKTFKSGAITYENEVSFNKSKMFVAAKAVGKDSRLEGPLTVTEAKAKKAVYECDDFSDFEDGKAIPAGAYGNYNGYSMDNYGTGASVVNDGASSYIKLVPNGDTVNENRAHRLVKTFMNTYSAGSARLSFSMKADSAERKTVTVGSVSLNLPNDGDFFLTGFDYPSGTNYNTAYIQRNDSYSDGKWHTFTFDLNFSENYMNIYLDGEIIEPYNCYWSASAYGSKPKKNIPIKDGEALSFVKFSADLKNDAVCIDNLQITDMPETMPSAVGAECERGTVTLSAKNGSIYYAVAGTAALAYEKLGEAELYQAPFALTEKRSYVAAFAINEEGGGKGPVSIGGPFESGSIVNIRYTDGSGNLLDGKLLTDSVWLKFTCAESELSGEAVTAAYDSGGRLVRICRNPFSAAQASDEKKFEMSGISADGAQIRLKTIFVKSLGSLSPICEPYEEILKLDTPEFNFESGSEGWTAESGSVYVTDRSWYEDDGTPIAEKEGTYFLSTRYNENGAEVCGEAAIVNSPVFTVKTPVITFVAGGGDSECRVHLCSADNEVLMSSDLPQKHLSRTVWNVSGYSGREVYIKLIDESSENGISIDAVRMTGIADESDADAAEGYYSGYCTDLNGAVTAAEFITAAVHASGNVSANEEQSIALAKSGNIASGDTAASQGKVKLYRSTDSFSLSEPITRGNAAVILSRLWDKDAQGDARRSDVADVNRGRYSSLISDYASIESEEMKTAAVNVFALGIMKTRGGVFAADEYITGSEAAAAIVRAFDSSRCASDYAADSGFYVPTVFGSGMVLQRNKPIHVWGGAADGSSISVRLESADGAVGTSASATAKNGKWEVVLDPVSDTTKSYTMTVSDGTTDQIFTDVLAGEVWLLSGQSNMQTPVNAYMDTSINGNIRSLGEDAASYSGKIRYFSQAHSYSSAEKQEVRRGTWLECNSANVWNFSATGYMFARKLHDLLNVPVGLVYAAQGATGIQTWMSNETLHTDSAVAERAFEQNSSARGSQGKSPSYFYNAMIAPIKGITLGGILWYQGESNAADGAFYETLLKTHISGMRNDFYSGADLPFVFMQLAPYSGIDFTQVRESMRKVSEEVSNTAMAVQIDSAPESNNPAPIHPYNKALVGERLARAAFVCAYGGERAKNLSPSFASAVKDGERLIVKLKDTSGELSTLDSEACTAFMIAGEDGAFYPADCEIIDGSHVALTSSDVAEPRFVRYAWGAQTVTDSSCNNFLYNSAMLPLGPFEARANAE